MRRLAPIALVAAGVLLSSCQSGNMPFDLSRLTGGLSDEQKIGMVLADVAQGMENRRVYQVLSHVSQRSNDREGRDYEALRKHVSAILDNYRTIRVTRTPSRVQVQGDRARVVDTFGTLAQPIDQKEYPNVDLQGRVVILLERSGGAWQILEWGPLF
jgi:hypothetical protein